jgi:hypothetical protein
MLNIRTMAQALKQLNSYLFGTNLGRPSFNCEPGFFIERHSAMQKNLNAWKPIAEDFGFILV